MAGESGTFIGLIVTSNVNEFRTERRFPSDINLANLKVSVSFFIRFWT